MVWIQLDKSLRNVHNDGNGHQWCIIDPNMMGETSIMSTYGMSDRAILREIGRRLRRKRLDKNWSQQRLADLAGLDRSTISEVERGASLRLLTLVQILRALEALEALDAFLPDPGVSPLELARMKGKERQRASGRTVDHDQGESDW